jgi:hypothetical protein
MTDDISPNLGLPLYQTKQDEFEIQHNEALSMLDALVMLAVKDRDLSAPPLSPAIGDRYLVKATGTGDFAGMDDRIAQFDIGGWNFYAPLPGWTCYVQDERLLLAWDGDSWEPALDVLSGMAELQNVSLLGVGTTADLTNPLSAKLNNVLWTAKTVAEGGDGHLRYKLSKESASKTLSLLFQDNFSGRAEVGLTGDDDFHFKVSPDGSSWLDAVVIDRTTGKLSIGQGFSDPAAIRAKTGAAPFSALAYNNAAVNGGISVSQELGTTGVTLTNNTARYTADCFEAMYNHVAGSAVVTSAQIPASSFGAALAGFPFGHQIKATTAITSPASGDFAKHRSKIEGYRIASWGWGASGALDIVAAFQLYSTASGTAFIKLSNSDQSRCFYHEIAVAAGWNFYAFSVPGDTSGTWQTTTSTGLTFEVFSSGKETTPASSLDTWGSTNKVQTTNSTNLLGSNNNCTILTGVYVAAGPQLPVAADLPNLMRSHPETLSLCQRYLAVLEAPVSGTPTIAMGQAFSSTQSMVAVPLPALTRVPVTGITIAAAGNFAARSATASLLTLTALSFISSTTTIAQLNATVASGLAAGDASGLIALNSSARIVFTGAQL